MSQRSQTFRAPRTSKVSGNFMASRPSLGAAKPPPSQPQVVDLTGEDEPPRKSVQGQPASTSEMIDLTGDSSSRSPSPPRSRPPAAKPASRDPLPRRRSPPARSPLLPVSRDSSPLPPLVRVPDQPGRGVEEEVPALKQASCPQIKISPQTLQSQRKQDQRNEPPSSKRHTPRRNPRNSTPQLSNEEDDEEEDVQNLQPSPSTPSKQASSRSHRRSQKSTDMSVSSSSPLITRLKQQNKSKQSNGPAKTRSQSPREAMARRSLSSEHVLNNQPLTQEELETSLDAFESKLKDDHAFGMKWLLQDVRETVADRRSSFFESPFTEKGGSSPWASKQGVQVRPGQPTHNASHIDKLDSFVSSKSNLII
jgi:hypothetical protein